MSKTKKYLRDFREDFTEKLKDRKRAESYFNAIIQETRYCKNQEEAQKLILSALRMIVQAQGGITKLAEKLDLPRGTISRALSPQGNPRLNTYLAVQNALFSKR